MRSRVGVFVGLILFESICRAQTPVVTYALHAGKLAHVDSIFRLSAAPPVPTVAASADKRVLYALIPQEKQKWQLQEVRDWDTATPQVKSLELAGDDRDDRQDFITGLLTPSPDGKLLVVRVMIYDLGKYVRSAVVVLIDLKTFQVVTRTVTNDPFVANSRWRFTREGLLIAVEGPSPTLRYKDEKYIPPDVLSMNPVSFGVHEGAVLSFPGLEMQQRCRYSAQSPPEHPLNVTVTALSPDCGDFLAVAGIKNGGELLAPYDAGRKFPGTENSSCLLEAYSADEKIQLSECKRGQMLEKYFQVFEREKDVTRVEDGEQLLTVPLKKNEDVSAALLRSHDRNYMVLLRGGLTVSVYVIP